MKKIDSYPPLHYAEDLKQICRPLSKLGINYFCHVIVDKNKKFSAIAMAPAFAKLYLEKKYYNHDIHLAGQNLGEKYILWDLLSLDKESRALKEDLCSFDLYHNFTIAQCENDHKSFFHFATSSKNHNANHNYLQLIDTLKKFTLHFKDKISRHKPLAASYQHKFSIDEKNARFHTQDEFDWEKHMDLPQFFPKRIFVSHCDTYLTQREFACLHWLAQAKTIDQIALLLGISARTVNAHIANIKQKTNCCNQFQLGILYHSLSVS